MPPAVGVIAAVGAAVNTVAVAVGATVGLSAATSLGVAGFLGKIAVGVGLTAAQRALTPTPSFGSTRRAGIEASTRIGEDKSQTLILGQFATPGDLVYQGSYGVAESSSPNAFLVRVFELADRPLDVTRFWVNGEYVETGLSTAPIGNSVFQYRHKSSNNLWFKTFNGNQTTAATYLRDEFGTDPDQPWLADMVGEGIPFVIMTARVNETVHRGVPEVLFETRGIPMYDPRKDSTRGGSGSQRLNSPSTWATSSNPIVQVYNIMIGFKDPITGAHMYGVQVDPDDMSASEWFAAMNECDVLVNGSPQYRSGIEIPIAEMSPTEAILEILNACQGQIAEAGGKYLVKVGASGTPVYYFNDEDVLLDATDEFEPFAAIDETIDGVVCTYVDPSDGYTARQTPLIGEEGNIAEVQLPNVCFAGQAQRIASSVLKTSKRVRKHTIVLPPEARRLTPLDRVGWTSERNFYSSKGFEIAMTEDLEDGNILLVLVETDPNDYDPPAIIATDTGYTSRPTTVLGGVLGFSVEAATIIGSNGQQRAAIRINWNKNVDLVNSIRWQVRLVSDTTNLPGQGSLENPFEAPTEQSVVFNGTPVEFNGEPVIAGLITDLTPGTALISDGILPNTAYEVRARYEPQNGIWDWSAWLPVTTSDIRLGLEDLDDAVTNFITNAEAAVDQAVQDAISGLNITNETVTNLENAIAAAEASADAQFATVTITVEGKTRTFRQPTAPIAEGINDLWQRTTDGVWFIATAVGAGGWVESTDPRVAANVTAIEEETGIRQTETSALALSVSTVTANLNSLTSSVTATSAALSNVENGLSAAYMLKVNAGSADGTLQLAAWDDGDLTGSSLKIDADYIFLKGKVTADSLLVNGSKDNLILDPYWRDPEYWGLTVTGGSSSTQWVIQDANNSTTRLLKSQRYRLRSPTQSTSDSGFSTGYFAIEPGETYTVKSYLRKYSNSDTCSGNVRIRFFQESTNDGYTIQSVGSTVSTTTVTKVEGTFTAPTWATRMQIGFWKFAGSGSMIFGFTEVRRQSDAAVLITPESITAPLLIGTQAVITKTAQVSDAIITNAKIANAAITTAKIGDLQVDRVKIGDNAVGTWSFLESLRGVKVGTNSLRFLMEAPGDFVARCDLTSTVTNLDSSDGVKFDWYMTEGFNTGEGVTNIWGGANVVGFKSMVIYGTTPSVFFPSYMTATLDFDYNYGSGDVGSATTSVKISVFRRYK